MNEPKPKLKMKWRKVSAPKVWHPKPGEELIGYYMGRTKRDGVLDITDGLDAACVVEGPVTRQMALRRELEIRAVARAELRGDHPEKTLHSWKVVSRVVKKASAKQIMLASFFPSQFRVQFTPEALGRHFFSTPSAAIEAFAKRQRAEIESLDHRRKEAERSLVWAYEHGARVPT